MNVYQNSIHRIGHGVSGYFTPAIAAHWSPRRRLFVVASAFALYFLAFVAIYPTLNTQTILLGALPVLITAWLFGLWGGMLSLPFTFFISMLLTRLAGEEQNPWQLLISPRVAIEMVFLFGFALIVGRLRDLTLQMQQQLASRQTMEAELRQSQELLVTTQQLANVGSWELDIVNNRMQWSDQLYRIYGLQPQEVAISYEDYLARVLPSDRTLVQEAIQRAHHNAQPFHFYERIVQPDQSVRTLYSQGQVKVDATTGKPIAMVGTCLDITEFKQSETQVLRREAILNAVAFAAAQFLQSGTWMEKLDVVLASLGHAIEANQILLFENYPDEQGHLLSSQRYRWVKPGYMPKHDANRWQNFSLTASGFAHWAKLMEQGESIYGPVSSLPESEQQLLDLQMIEGLVVMPIFVGEKWWGFIGVDYSQFETQWSMMAVEAFKTATRLLGAALYRQQSLEESRNQAARAHSLVDTASRLNAQLDVQSIVRTVCDEAIKALGVSVSTISLYDGKLQSFRYAWGSGVPTDFAQRVQALRTELDPPLTPDAQIEHRDGLVITYDVQSLRTLPNADLYTEMDLRTTINVTLQREGRLIGRLNIGTTGKPRKFSEDDLELLKGLADHAVTALENARLYQESLRHTELLEAINKIITTVVLSPDLQGLLNTSLAHILQTLNLTTGIIWASGHYATQGIRPHIDPLITRIIYPNQGPTSQDTLDQQKEEWQKVDWQVADWQAVQAEDPAYAFACAVGHMGLTAAFFIPLLNNGQQLGGIIVGQNSPRTWNVNEITLMRVMGQQLNAAIERFDLYKREHERTWQVQQILELAPEGMLLLDAEQRVVLSNLAARKYLTLLSDTGINERLIHLGNESIAAFLQMPADPLTWHEVVVDSPQRHIFEIMAHSLAEASTFGKAGRAADGQSYLFVLRDVTQERQRHEYLQTQERLATVGQLAAGIAHDFNNILTPILLYTDMSLAKLPADSRVRHSLQQVLVAANRAKELIFQILAFGRQGAKQGRKLLQVQPIVKETLKLLRAVLPSTIEIEQNLDGQIGTVLADATQIHQVLMNLCTNAYHAMSRGGGVLRVDLELTEVDAVFAAQNTNLKPGSYVRLSVRDNGYGMDRATLAHIFDPFFTTKSVGEGTGMGLAVVYGIVMEHEGAITVDSHPSQGSTFRIYLPQTQEANPTGEEEIEQTIVHGQESILVVDDEEAVALGVQASLENIGYGITICTDSTEALNLFRANPDRFDLVLSDLTMPRMTGVELVRHLVTIRPQIPIILASGYGSDFTREVINELGVRAYLMKPFAQSVLSQTIRQVLDRQS